MFLKKLMVGVLLLSVCFFAHAMEERDSQSTDPPRPSLEESECKVVTEL